jgi:hypothetical protein
MGPHMKESVYFARKPKYVLFRAETQRRKERQFDTLVRYSGVYHSFMRSKDTHYRNIRKKRLRVRDVVNDDRQLLKLLLRL